MNNISTFFSDGVLYIKNHPQLLFTLLLVIVIPLAFFVSGQQFLNASKENQGTLENDRIGLMHDLFLSVIKASNSKVEIIQSEIDQIASLNPDIVVFRVSKKTSEGYVPVAALNKEMINVIEEDSSVYNLAFTRTDESLIQAIEISSERFIRGVRLVENPTDTFVILTLTSRSKTDELFSERIRDAYYWLFGLLIIILFLVLRHVRLIDYGYLYKETKKANEMKDLFTNMIAHELRAPLTAMKGYASMIDESKDTPDEEKKYAIRIKDSSDRLLTIVNDLLDVARIQSGKLKIEKTNADISFVVLSVCDELKPSALEKEIKLSHSGTNSEHILNTDPKRMHQAITNLVSNAIKYTKHGSIELSLEDKPTYLEIRVKDTGMGISAKDQKQLFAPFFRVESDDVSQITGTGLGMWITRQLIELLGATIGVESIKGVGTHIVISIPK